jgi:ABC-type lipoprotein export system ATPase subunit
MNREETLICGVDVTKVYGEETILRPSSFAVRAGGSTSIMAPSGTGKSTLLAILGLLMKPTDGTIFVQGRNVATLSDEESAGLRNIFFGTIFQASHLIGSLTVLDNVLVPARLAGRANTARAVAEEWLERLGLSDRRRHLPHMLSVGQKRRVAIARALVLRPSVVLADEPTNDLDETRAGEIADFLFRLPQEGFTLVIATHDRFLASRAENQWAIAAHEVKTIQTAVTAGVGV